MSVDKLLWFLAPLILFTYQSAGCEAVRLTLYLESLCPDSMRFVKDQLGPTYRQLGQYMQVDFVPYGFANYTLSPWSMTCQHGPRECLGNAVQACVLDRYTSNLMQVAFIVCLMSDKQPHLAGPKCAKQLGYDYLDIAECSVSEEARRLLIGYGEKTKELTPSLTWVPLVTFDDVFNQKDQDDAMTQLSNVICDKIQGQKPNICTNEVQ